MGAPPMSDPAEDDPPIHHATGNSGPDPDCSGEKICLVLSVTLSFAVEVGMTVSFHQQPRSK